MIRNEADYQVAVGRLAEEKDRLRQQLARLNTMNLSKSQIKRVLDPLRSFHLQLKEEVQSYERLQRGEFDELRNFAGVGRLLIALRIASGLGQRELAERLQVHESQVSRDERNEYRGVTVERANKVLEALGAEVRTRVFVRPTNATQAKRNRASA
jgi:hypothetical protein